MKMKTKKIFTILAIGMAVIGGITYFSSVNKKKEKPTKSGNSKKDENNDDIFI